MMNVKLIACLLLLVAAISAQESKLDKAKGKLRTAKDKVLILAEEQNLPLYFCLIEICDLLNSSGEEM